MPIKLKIFAAFILFPFFCLGKSTADHPYCLTIHANGELVVGQWGALESLIEKKGLPSLTAGISSSSYTLFLLDAISSSPFIAGQPVAVQKSRTSLFFKSISGFIDLVENYPENRFIINLAYARGLGTWSTIQFLVKTVFSGDVFHVFHDLSVMAKNLHKVGLLEGPQYLDFIDFLDRPLSIFYPSRFLKIADALWSINANFFLVGSLNPAEDPDFFVRPGTIYFKGLSEWTGRAMSFYAGKNWNPQTKEYFQDFLNKCEPLHLGKTWEELIALEPDCGRLIRRSLRAYYEQDISWENTNVVHYAPVHPTIITTTLLTGAAAEQGMVLTEKYRERERNNFIFPKDFFVDAYHEVRLGYWGPKEILKKIKMNLNRPFKDRLGRRFDYSKDYKSSLFTPLPPVAWQQMLDYSTAEPGVSPWQEFDLNGKKVLSTGGWLNLYQAPILKAAGCDEVIYISLQSPPTSFTQQIAIRLFHLDKDAAFPRHKMDKDFYERAKFGDPADQTSLWSQLYNAANPNSAFNQSLAAADAVVCTSWRYHQFSLRFVSLLETSYRAPYFVSSSNPRLREELESAGANIMKDPFSKTDGIPDWQGCVPFQRPVDPTKI